MRCILVIVMISNHGIGTLENLKSNFHKLEIQIRLLIIFFLFLGEVLVFGFLIEVCVQHKCAVF